MPKFYEKYWEGQDNYLSDFEIKWLKLKKFISYYFTKREIKL